MSTIWDGLYSDITTAVQTIWPEVASMFFSVDVETVNWRTAAEQSTLTFPFVVIHIPPARETEGFGMDLTIWTTEVHYFYIVQENAPVDMTTLLADKLHPMSLYLLQSGHPPLTSMQVLEMASQDTSELNRCTEVFHNQGAAIRAGSVGIKVLFGELITGN